MANCPISLIDRVMDTKKYDSTKSLLRLETEIETGNCKAETKRDRHGRPATDVYDASGKELLLHMYYNPNKHRDPDLKWNTLGRGLVIVRPDVSYRVLPQFCKPLDGDPTTSEKCLTPKDKIILSLKDRIARRQAQLATYTTPIADLGAALRAFAAFLQKYPRPSPEAEMALKEGALKFDIDGHHYEPKRYNQRHNDVKLELYSLKKHLQKLQGHRENIQAYIDRSQKNLARLEAQIPGSKTANSDSR